VKKMSVSSKKIQSGDEIGVGIALDIIQNKLK
jgi:hypothetical protein